MPHKNNFLEAPSIFTMLLFVSLSFTSFCAELSNSLLTYKKQKSESQHVTTNVLVCGERKFYPADAIKHMMTQIAAINPHKPLSCLLALPASSSSVMAAELMMSLTFKMAWTEFLMRSAPARQVNETYNPNPHNLSVLLDEYKKSPEFEKYLNISYGDCRSHESNLMFGSAAQAFFAFINEFSQGTTVTDEVISRTLLPFLSPPLSVYFESLETDQRMLEKLIEKHREPNPSFSLIVSNLLKNFLQAKDKITRFFSTCSRQPSINEALGQVARQCNSNEVLLAAFKALLTIAHEITQPIFIAGTIEKLLHLIEHDNRTILVVVDEAIMVDFARALMALNFNWIRPLSQTKSAEILNKNLSVLTKRLLSEKEFCWSCYKSFKGIRKCSKCSTACYCDSTCQKNDWPNHKEFCGLVARKADSFDA